MRLWSIHPKYLDAKGLVALWREGLLAQKVLRGQTRGYKNHPQLMRFKNLSDPITGIGTYLLEVYREADIRGYSFDRTKIHKTARKTLFLKVSSKQRQYEFVHLLRKLRVRSRSHYKKVHEVKRIKLHPIFRSVAGPIESWEILSNKKA